MTWRITGLHAILERHPSPIEVSILALRAADLRQGELARVADKDIGPHLSEKDRSRLLAHRALGAARA